jgi:hypothetical protein
MIKILSLIFIIILAVIIVPLLITLTFATPIILIVSFSGKDSYFTNVGNSYSATYKWFKRNFIDVVTDIFTWI